MKNPSLWECNVIDVNGKCIDTFHFAKDIDATTARQRAWEGLHTECDEEFLEQIADIHVIDLDTGKRVS